MTIAAVDLPIYLVPCADNSPRSPLTQKSPTLQVYQPLDSLCYSSHTANTAISSDKEATHVHAKPHRPNTRRLTVSTARGEARERKSQTQRPSYTPKTSERRLRTVVRHRPPRGFLTVHGHAYALRNRVLIKPPASSVVASLQPPGGTCQVDASIPDFEFVSIWISNEGLRLSLPVVDSILR